MEIESEHQSVLSNAMYSVPISLIVIRGRIIQTKKTDPPENLVLLERKKIIGLDKRKGCHENCLNQWFRSASVSAT